MTEAKYSLNYIKTFIIEFKYFYLLHILYIFYIDPVTPMVIDKTKKNTHIHTHFKVLEIFIFLSRSLLTLLNRTWVQAESRSKTLKMFPYVLIRNFQIWLSNQFQIFLS